LLGVDIVTNNGELPINLKGPLMPFDFQMDGSLSSQFLTGILFAISHKTEKQVNIDVSNLKSAPYIDITLEVLKDFGCDVINENYERFIINPPRKIEKTLICDIEGDWSSASFLLVAGAIAGSIELKGLSLNSKQADRAIITALSLAEARISISDELIKVEKPFGNRKLRPFHFDATHCPDLFPPLVALAAYCDGISIIEGVNRLFHKESNRANSLQETFVKLGVKIILQDDWMIVHGGEAVTGGVIHSFQDHRIAMACSVAGLSAMSAVTVEESEVVKKSYPRFYKDVDLIRKK
jgi:3-phosphoshikimate 1-carboxyvinyltransferase